MALSGHHPELLNMVLDTLKSGGASSYHGGKHHGHYTLDFNSIDPLQVKNGKIIQRVSGHVQQPNDSIQLNPFKGVRGSGILGYKAQGRHSTHVVFFN